MNGITLVAKQFSFGWVGNLRTMKMSCQENSRRLVEKPLQNFYGNIFAIKKTFIN